MSQFRYVSADGRNCDWLPYGKGSYHAIAYAMADQWSAFLDQVKHEETVHFQIYGYNLELEVWR